MRKGTQARSVGSMPASQPAKLPGRKARLTATLCPPACRCRSMRSSWAAKCIARGSGGACSTAAAREHRHAGRGKRTREGAEASPPRPSAGPGWKLPCSCITAPARPPGPSPGRRSQGPAGSPQGPGAPPARCSAGPAAARLGPQRGVGRRLERGRRGPCRGTCSGRVRGGGRLGQAAGREMWQRARHRGLARDGLPLSHSSTGGGAASCKRRPGGRPVGLRSIPPHAPHHSQGQGGASTLSATSAQSPPTPWYTRA